MAVLILSRVVPLLSTVESMKGYEQLVKEVVEPQLQELVASAKKIEPRAWTKKRRQEAFAL
jgi:hypothetical protein